LNRHGRLLIRPVFALPGRLARRHPGSPDEVTVLKQAACGVAHVPGGSA